MQPRITALLWRDSVAAGDDVDAPHEVALRLSADVTIGSLCSQILSLDYLPSISGGRATWILQGRKALAVFAQQWTHPKLLLADYEPAAPLLFQERTPQLRFLYWCQVEPGLVYQNLVNGLPLPDKSRP